MANDIKLGLQSVRRKVGTLIKDISKSPALTKELKKSLSESFNAIVSVLNSIETDKLDAENKR